MNTILRRVGLFILIGILSSATIYYLSTDYLPRPMFDRQIFDPDDPYCFITANNPLIVQLSSPRPDIHSISFPLSIPPGGEVLEIVVRNPENDMELWRSDFSQSGSGTIDFSVLDLKTDAIRIEFYSKAINAKQAPRLL